MMISTDNIKETFAGLVAVDSPSLRERNMADHLKKLFADIGIVLEEDDSASETGSDAGNLYGYVKGNGGPSLLLSAHMDTVMPGYGKKAVFHEDGKVTGSGSTVLGADDVSGITEIYEALRYLKKTGRPHRDVELLFTTGEELYGKGAKAFRYEKIRSRSAVVLDLSGRIGDVAYAAPTIISFEAEVFGKAAHAGFCPENGIHAVKACCEAVSLLSQGHIGEDITANIGQISGGEGVNIVPEKCAVKGEIRSMCHEKAVDMAKQYRQVFSDCSEKYGARLKWREQTDIQAYETSLQSGIAVGYEQACKQAGVAPRWIKTFGGSDNNVFALNGIEGIVAACSMNNVHSCGEYANVAEMAKVSEILIELITQGTGKGIQTDFTVATMGAVDIIYGEI